MIVRTALFVVLALVVAAIGYAIYMVAVANPRVARDLIDDPEGERAKKVMLIRLPSGREIPVNYLRDEDRVYAGADGRWWRELEAGDAPVTVVVRGETMRGRARAVLDDPSYTKRIFARLRPNALPGFGTLVEVRLDGAPIDDSRP